MKHPSLKFLFWVIIVNYVAQIPYYLYNYYFRYHVPPTMSSIVLLGLTLGWFVLGYVAVQRQKRFGYFVLLSFLLVEALFYAHTILLGAFIFQLQNPNPIIKVVFIVGYLSGIVAGYYAYLLIRYKQRFDGRQGSHERTR